jgi:hypothetical protein
MEADDREFMRQLLLRHEKATDAMAIRAHTREFVAEMRAQRQALSRVLDRLDSQGA